MIESETFSIFIEQERYVRDLLDAYMNSKFKEVLAILDANSVSVPKYFLSSLTPAYCSIDATRPVSASHSTFTCSNIANTVPGTCVILPAVPDCPVGDNECCLWGRN